MLINIRVLRLCTTDWKSSLGFFFFEGAGGGGGGWGRGTKQVSSSLRLSLAVIISTLI